MIGSLKGKVVGKGLTHAIIDVGGVGYSVNSIPAHLENIKIGADAFFWVHTAVREDDISLYGFGSDDELRMFRDLIGISGIGPKSALAIISVAGLKALQDAISSGDTSILTKIGGIGRKTADKIVLELSGKLSTSEMSQSAKDDLDTFEALRALGYREHQIKDVLKKIPVETSGAGEKIKTALKLLGKS